MSLVEFIQVNFSGLSPVVSAVALGIIWIVIHDFYHALHTAVLSWFKK